MAGITANNQSGAGCRTIRFTNQSNPHPGMACPLGNPAYDPACFAPQRPRICRAKPDRFLSQSYFFFPLWMALAGMHLLWYPSVHGEPGLKFVLHFCAKASPSLSPHFGL